MGVYLHSSMKVPGISLSTLIIAVCCGFLTPFDLSAVNIALPTIAGEFSLDAIELSWVSSAYLLASAAFLVPFGRIGDIFGRKKILTGGVILFTLSSMGMIFSASSLMLISFRLIQGVGASMIFGTAVAILTSVTEPTRRGQALGIYTTSVYIGLSAGPFIGGFLTDEFGWKSIFLINVPIGILIIALILFYLKGEWADAAGERFDLKGALIYGSSLTAVMIGFSEIPQVAGFFALGLGIILLALFIWLEHRERYPLIRVSMFRTNRVFACSNVAALINYGSTFAITFFLSLYLQYIRGFDPQEAGFILVTQPVVQAIFSSYAGSLSDRIEPAKISSLGMGIIAVGLVSLSFLSPDTSTIWLMVILAVLGFGFALFSSPNTNAIMSSVEKRYYGIASGTLGTMRLLGQMLSMGIAMMIIAVVVGKVDITPDMTDELMIAMNIGFMVFSVMCFIGIYFSMVRGNVRSD
ncbi:MFS transporter [Methanospirillum hungatei]|jgi:EmrB/QacA subfamily drug resistance transporter|uniref:MFS transporter n=1 Tax=Methanospirillum hungatei TaxID=2203 RepID=UPI0009D5D6C9|nr:MFS transporter [Methanospirillum hungatei]MBP9007095.1 MFS transporter [Methanospirillum sp.]OQA60658.1 MAG: putative transporter [Euryarchaeota archaeon ADurb.Bin294]HOW03655.1 MFS transporter [Methanospirillum hungatei]